MNRQRKSKIVILVRSSVDLLEEMMADANSLAERISVSDHLSPIPFVEALRNQPDYNDQEEDWDFDQDEESVLTEEEGENDAVPPTNIPLGWKWVEVVGSYDDYEGQGGGGFILRDYDDTATLAQFFPVVGDSGLFVEAFTLKKAITEIICLGEMPAIFYIRSAHLYARLHEAQAMPRQPTDRIIYDILQLGPQLSGIRFALWPTSSLLPARWLAKRGRICQQHCRWVGEWPEELVALL